MISKYHHKELNWVDLESPKEEEIIYILEEYTIPIFIKDEIFSKPTNDVIRLDHGFIFAYLNFSSDQREKSDINKVIFIISDNYIITIHDKPIETLSEFLKEMELDTIENKKFDINNNKLLFAHLMKSLFVNSQKQILSNTIRINTLKKQLGRKNKQLISLFLLATFLIIVIILLSIYVISLI